MKKLLTTGACLVVMQFICLVAHHYSGPAFVVLFVLCQVVATLILINTKTEG